MSDENFALPGEEVGTPEEAVQGKGAYEENDGIYAAVAGRIIREHGELSVLPKKEIIRIAAGQVVYGMVADVMENLALIEILPSHKGRERHCPPSDYGVLRVMNIREGFVPSAKNEMKRGDLVVAKVENLTFGIGLTTKGFDFGVIKAYCAYCRHDMGLMRNVLKCNNCGRIDNRRKLSRAYGQEVVLAEIRF